MACNIPRGQLQVFSKTLYLTLASTLAICQLRLWAQCLQDSWIQYPNLLERGVSLPPVLLFSVLREHLPLPFDGFYSGCSASRHVLMYWFNDSDPVFIPWRQDYDGRFWVRGYCHPRANLRISLLRRLTLLVWCGWHSSRAASILRRYVFAIGRSRRLLIMSKILS